MLLLNSGRRAEARRCLASALALDPRDRNIHQNAAICDMLDRRPKDAWHVVPDAAAAGRDTLLAYFDPHGA